MTPTYDYPAPSISIDIGTPTSYFAPQPPAETFPALAATGLPFWLVPLALFLLAAGVLIIVLGHRSQLPRESEDRNGS